MIESSFRITSLSFATGAEDGRVWSTDQRSGYKGGRFVGAVK
jgi:hypothetical protein